jgi:hypothetical protein
LNARLALNPPDFSGTNLVKHLQKLRNEWPKVNEAIGAGTEHDHRKRQPVNALLKRKIAINCDKRIELPGGSGEKRPIAHPGPTKANDSCNFVT